MYFAITKDGSKMFLNKNQVHRFDNGDYVFYDNDTSESEAVMLRSPSLVTKEEGLSKIIFAENATRVDLPSPGAREIHGGGNVN